MTGYAENFIGLQEFMSAEIGARVKGLSGLETLKTDISAQNVGEYISCMGAVVAPLDFIPDEHNPKKKKKTALVKGKDGEQPSKVGSADYTRLAVLVCVAGVVIGIVLAVASVLPYLSAQRTNEELVKREAELAPVEIIYNEYTSMQLFAEDVKQMYRTTQTHNEELLAFIYELEEKMPSLINVLTFTATNDDVTMNIQLDSKESAALTMMELRDFDSIENINVASVAEVADELGAATVNFTITATYAPLIFEEDTEQTEGEVQ